VKVLLPLSCVLLLGAALWQLLVPEQPGIPWRGGFNPWSFTDWRDAHAVTALVTQTILTLIGVALFTAIVLWVLYCAATGRNLKQRLTDPAPIITGPAEGEPAAA
jgi:ABC-type uncharacterized transport system permease subunit